MEYSPLIWPRAIILVDMNAFFAAVEQLDHPEWRGRPVAVTNGAVGSCIITCSYEARAFGIKTGMRLRQAQQLCPGLIRAPSRPHRYSELSRRIMHALENITPDIEIFSIDEAFLDITACQRYLGSPGFIARATQRTVWEASGLLCSIGLSGDKTTAKYAAKQRKPHGFTVIPPWQARATLAPILVTELCGIGPGISDFLARYGATTCGDVAKLPIGILAKRFGNWGRRIWLMCQGIDPEPLILGSADPKSMGHGKVLPPNTRDHDTLLTYLLHMAEKLAARLRRHEFEAQNFFIGLRCVDRGWLGGKYSVPHPTQDGATIYALCQYMLDACWQQQVITQVQITALDPQPATLQGDLFLSANEPEQHLHNVIDAVNQRYGAFTLAPARLLNRSSMPNVIAPAWKPHGHRQTI